jgi:hypothetical protein
MKNIYKSSLTTFLVLLSFAFCYGQQTGIVKTERSAPKGIVSFSATSKLTGISDAKHVDGYVEKAGTGLFTFPVGHKGVYRPFAGEADGTIGAYFLENPSTASLPAGGPFLVSSKESSIKAVSTTEFWDIDGANASRITLTWKAESNVGILTENTLPLLSIAGWNPSTSRWEKIASAFDEVSLLGGSSTLSEGSITTIQSLVPNTYSVYCLAALTDASAPVNYEGNLETVTCSEIKGWVWDKNYQDATLTVELVEGNIVYATATANVYRADLQNSGIGTGNYGFRMDTPSSLMDGRLHQLSIRVRGSTKLISGSSKTLSCAYEGKVEVVDCNMLSGWLWDKNNPDTNLTVEVLEGNVVQAVFVANMYRADLKNAGIGTGYYGFAIPLPTSMRDGQAHQLDFRIKGTTYVLQNDKVLTCQVPTFVGSFEKADCNTVNGWVWASNYPGLAFSVELLEGSTVLGTTVAGNYRDDLKNGGIGTGKYGFSMALPASLKNDQPHQLNIRIKGSSYVIPGLPRTVTCATPFQLSGQLEQADCGTVRGWAWASNYPDSAFTVELLEGSTLLATAVANTYRADLKNSGQGTGNYGFSIALPASIKNGQPHQLSVRIKGSSVVLSGSPKTVTCAALPQLSGSFEKADCNTVNGWVWASNYPDSAFTVELLEGSVVVGTTVAGNYRVDLKDAGKGTGKYGFSLAVPASLKTGQARAS